MVSTLFLFMRFMRRSGVSMGTMLYSVALLTLSTLFEGASLGLVIPLLDALFKKGDYSLAKHIPVLGEFLGSLPSVRFRVVLMVLLASILAATVMKHLFMFASEILLSRLNRHAEHELRSRLFERYLSFGKRYVDSRKIGELCEWAGQQVIIACEVFHLTHSVLMNLLLAAVYLGMMIFVSWKMTLCAMAILPPMYLLVRWISRRIIASSGRKLELDQRMSSSLLDALTNLSLIQSSVNEAEELRRFRKVSQSSRAAVHSITKKIFFAPHAQDVVVSLGTALLVAASSFFYLKEGAGEEVAFFVAFFIALRRFSGAIMGAGSSFVASTRSSAAMRRVLEIFDDAGKSFVRGGNVKFEALREGIEFKNVVFSYGSAPVLRGLNARFPKGKMTAVVGATGAGKTTLTSLLLRFYDPDAGAILVDGRPIADYDLASLRLRFAAVDQQASVLNATIRENITYGLRAQAPQEAVDRAAESAAILPFILSLPEGYETVVGDRGVRLSGGERQRIAIARAILKDPDVFIFDEATSSLDNETERAVQKSLEELRSGRTLIVIAHRLSTVRSADHIVVMDAGRVVEEGRFDELIARNGVFRKHWELTAS